MIIADVLIFRYSLEDTNSTSKMNQFKSILFLENILRISSSVERDCNHFNGAYKLSCEAEEFAMKWHGFRETFWSEFLLIVN